MMTIKIIVKLLSNREVIYLYKGYNISYEYVNYDEYEKWRNVCYEETAGLQFTFYCLMDDIKENDKNIRGLIIHFVTDTDDAATLERVIFTRNAIVYIMQDGKTIDKIYY